MVSLLSGCSSTPLYTEAEVEVEAGKEVASTNLYWGDTHLHTSYSPDAALMGNSKIGPEEAYKLARGEAVMAHNGTKAKLRRPLDFLVVSDHAEYLGLLPMIRAKDPIVMGNKDARRWGELLSAGQKEAQVAFLEMLEDLATGKPRIQDERITRSAWDTITSVADKYNDPGKFTAFIGYEWTSNTKGNNLHRVVIFKDGVEKAGQILPFSSLDSDNPEDLWKFLDSYEKKTGGEVLAIAHNGNLSNGLMFQMTDFSGKPMTENYAQTRMRWEPLYEVTQIKGDGETHPILSPEDEFADFESWDKGNLDGSTVKKNSMLKHEYGRSALKLGLQLEANVGTNPYKFGLIGSSDAHSGLAAVAEDNYWGKLSIYEPSPTRWKHYLVKKGEGGKVFSVVGWEMGAAGYAGVWAKENTREALYEAMKRKETFATTGPRMRVRFFGGWNFNASDVMSSDLAAVGYGRGVPMGGDLADAPKGMAPSFLISAVKDPDGANLDRIQVIKGWLDENGSTHEKIYDVALSDDRTVGKDGKVKPVGNTVDVKNASYTNTIGDAGFVTWWQDPDFDSDQRAFYYVRVIEIPTPRWTAYDSKVYNVKMSKEVPMTLQERAYTSPIWYTP